MVVRRKMTGLQLLFVTLLSPPVIVAEDLDPVEFLISKNYPRNRTLIPLPKNFDKFGDQKNDCCALQLFVEVKDYNAEGTGNGDGYSDNESQTQTGRVTFNFEHPAIRKSNIKFTMNVEKDKDKVKSKHLLNFDNCTNIEYKTFNISATTTIADDKDVRVVLVNGKDAKIACTDPNPAPAPEPREDQADNDIVLLCIIAALTTGWLLTLFIYNYRKIKKICSNTYIKLTTSHKQEVINLSVGGDQSESAAPPADSETSKDREGGEVKEKSSRTKKRGVRENPRAVEGASNLRAESGAPGQPELTEDSDSSDEERGSVNNIKSLGSQTGGKNTYIKLTTSQKQEVINLSGQSESAASRADADSDSDTSKNEKGGVVKEKLSRSKKRGGRENPHAVKGASNLHAESGTPDQPVLTEVKESDNNEKCRPRSKSDVSSNSDSDSSDEERGSMNIIKSLGCQTRGKKTCTEGVDKCGWITKIWKNKPLFFNVVVTCVWFVLSAIIVGIVFIL